MGLRGEEAPKIVQIETRYVQTDAVNFRDVVQSLTGKNSSTAWIGRNNGVAASQAIQGGFAKPHHAASAFSGTTIETFLPSSSSSMQMNNNLSFNGFMLPPTDMMPSSYS